MAISSTVQRLSISLGGGMPYVGHRLLRPINVSNCSPIRYFGNRLLRPIKTSICSRNQHRMCFSTEGDMAPLQRGRTAVSSCTPIKHGRPFCTDTDVAMVQRGRAAVAGSYAIRSVDEQKEHYDKWASTYDEDQNARGYLAPLRTAEALADQLEASQCGSQPVLDAGSGTGLMGPELHKLGFSNLTALDLSEGMLVKARGTGAYSKVVQGVLGESLPFESDFFAAVVSSGTFTEGHAPASSFDELVRVTKPDGRIVFTLKCDIKDSAGFTQKFDELAAARKWELVTSTGPIHLHRTAKEMGDPFLEILSFRVL